MTVRIFGWSALRETSVGSRSLAIRTVVQMTWRTLCQVHVQVQRFACWPRYSAALPPAYSRWPESRWLLPTNRS